MNFQQLLTARKRLIDRVVSLYRFSESEAVYFIDTFGGDYERAVLEASTAAAWE